MSNLLSLQFWFNLRPGSLILLYKNLLIGVIAAFLVLAIILFFLKKKKWSYSKLIKKLFNFFSTNIFIGLLLFFFNQERVPFLSARFWYFLWLIGMLIWLGFIIKYLKELPGKKRQKEKTHEYTKYIP